MLNKPVENLRKETSTGVDQVENVGQADSIAHGICIIMDNAAKKQILFPK